MCPPLLFTAVKTTYYILWKQLLIETGVTETSTGHCVMTGIVDVDSFRITKAIVQVTQNERSEREIKKTYLRCNFSSHVRWSSRRFRQAGIGDIGDAGDAGEDNEEKGCAAARNRGGRAIITFDAILSRRGARDARLLSGERYRPVSFVSNGGRSFRNNDIPLRSVNVFVHLPRRRLMQYCGKCDTLWRFAIGRNVIVSSLSWHLWFRPLLVLLRVIFIIVLNKSIYFFIRNKLYCRWIFIQYYILIIKFNFYFYDRKWLCFSVLCRFNRRFFLSRRGCQTRSVRIVFRCTFARLFNKLERNETTFWVSIAISSIRLLPNSIFPLT